MVDGDFPMSNGNKDEIKVINLNEGEENPIDKRNWFYARADFREAKSLHHVAIIGMFVVCTIFIIAGLAFIYLGAYGNSEVNILGMTITSANVGIVSVFLGAAIFIYTIRVVFKSTSEILKL